MTANVHPFPTDLVAKRKASGAIVTPSYAGDLERCRLLCETMDRYVTGHSTHYLLVEGRDIPLFKQFESARRRVVDERDILPGWLRAYWDPTSLFRRRVWLSTHTKPLRGWHVQQLRRIAIAQMVDDDNLVYVDSDVAFVRPFDVSTFDIGGKTRLFRRENGLEAGATPDHRPWHANAAALLGIREPQVSPHDYITTLIAWRRQTVVDMCAHIELINERNWVEAIAAERKFSECTIYGRYVDEVIRGADHVHSGVELCQVQWHGEAKSEAELREFVAGMSPDQVAIAMQSFIGTDVTQLRRVLAAA
jgi:hypothetical protein